MSLGRTYQEKGQTYFIINQDKYDKIKDSLSNFFEGFIDEKSYSNLTKAIIGNIDDTTKNPIHTSMLCGYDALYVEVKVYYHNQKYFRFSFCSTEGEKLFETFLAIANYKGLRKTLKTFKLVDD